MGDFDENQDKEDFMIPYDEWKYIAQNVQKTTVYVVNSQKQNFKRPIFVKRQQNA